MCSTHINKQQTYDIYILENLDLLCIYFSYRQSIVLAFTALMQVKTTIGKLRPCIVVYVVLFFFYLLINKCVTFPHCVHSTTTTNKTTYFLRNKPNVYIQRFIIHSNGRTTSHSEVICCKYVYYRVAIIYLGFGV